VATPELGLDAILLTMPLLGVPFAMVRVIAAASVAVVLGFVIGRRIAQLPARRALPLAGAASRSAARGGWRAALRHGASDSVDTTAPWIALGLVVAALLAPWLERARFADVPAVVQLPLFALLGLPVYVCASAATPLVAVLISAGVSPRAGLAFLPAGTGRTAGRALRADNPSPLALPALTVVSTLYAVSLLRRGPRAFLGELRWSADAHLHADSAPTQADALALATTPDGVRPAPPARLTGGRTTAPSDGP